MSALSYRFFKLIYGTWLVEIAKENLSVAKYTNLKIAKITCREIFI